MQADVLTPTLAYTEAREVCVDVAALFAGSQAELGLPPAASLDSGSACIAYDERVQVQLTLRLPSMPSMLPPPSSEFDEIQTLDASCSVTLPPLLFTLLSYLHISLRGTAKGDGTRPPFFVHYWQRLPMPTGFHIKRSLLSRPTKSDAPEAKCLCDAAFSPGVTFDAQAKAWVVRWASDVCVPYTSTESTRDTVHIEAAMQLRLELARLTLDTQAPPPQMPFHYASNDMHPFSHSDDPYLIDVDFLNELSDTVKILDESPRQRLNELSKRLMILPLSMLAPGSLGTDITAPWSESRTLVQQLQHAKEQEQAARASDADIALAPLSHAPAPSIGPHALQRDMPAPPSTSQSGTDSSAAARRTIDLATLASYGPVVLTSAVSTTAAVCASVAVRMRTLSRGLPSRETGPDTMPRTVMVCVEMEALPMPTPFQLHAIHIDVGEKSELAREAGFMPSNDTIYAVIQPMHGHASDMPVTLGRHAQYNLLFSVYLGLHEHDADGQTLARRLTTWDPRRSTRVTMLGTPVRGDKTAPFSTCVSQWNGNIDLSLALLDLQRRSFAEHVLHSAMGIAPAPPARDTRAMTMGDAAVSANALQSTRRLVPVRLDDTAAYGAPEPGASADVRCALGWNESDAQGGGFDPTRVSSFASCLIATLETHESRAEQDSPLIHVHVALSNVSTGALDIQISWLSEPLAPGQTGPTLVAETGRVWMGYVTSTYSSIIEPGMSRHAELRLRVLAGGFHHLGHVCVTNMATETQCVLQHIGSVYIDL